MQPCGPLADAREGDLVAFDAGKEKGIANHIGMIIGRDAQGRLLMIHAPRTGDVVKVVPMTRKDVMAVRQIVE